MELLVIIGVVALLRFIAGRMTPDEANPEAPPLPVAPARRRAVRRRPADVNFTPEPRVFSDEPTIPTIVPVAPRPVLARVAPRRALAPAFRGKEALRKAMIVREVLGPPVSLR
jgi:hypothetical protein